MTTVNIFETFASIQGESSYAGFSCFFIRLSGCNLQCRYCDTRETHRLGKDVSIDSLVSEAGRSNASIVEITGGEPLLQASFPELASRLMETLQQPVLVETNGSLDISMVPAGVHTIMDVKCPGSEASNSLDLDNLSRLRPEDEVKFVLSSREDYEWSKRFIEEHHLTSRCGAVFFSPVTNDLSARDLAEWLLADGLDVRLQVQLHRILGMK